MKSLIFVLIFLSPMLSLSLEIVSTPANCVDKVERRANIQVQVILSSNQKSCFLNISSRQSSNLVYRSYLMSDEGLFMVFNSFGDGEIDEDTGARNFYFFPRLIPNPTYQWNDQDQVLEVIHTNGDKFLFDYKTAEIKGIGQGQVTVAADISKVHRGGVEILNYKGLLLDAGFAIGRSPSAVGSGDAVFKDHQGQFCSLKNRELFEMDKDQDIRFMFDDPGLKLFLNKRCPQLNNPAIIFLGMSLLLLKVELRLNK